jgi:hypothetical protein
MRAAIASQRVQCIVDGIVTELDGLAHQAMALDKPRTLPGKVGQHPELVARQLHAGHSAKSQEKPLGDVVVGLRRGAGKLRGAL